MKCKIQNCRHKTETYRNPKCNYYVFEYFLCQATTFTKDNLYFGTNYNPLYICTYTIYPI